MPVEIRTATVDDAGAVAALNQALFPYVAKTDEQFRHDLQRAADDPARGLLAAWSDGRLVGYASAVPATWRSVPGAFYQTLFVDKAFRGQGIGSELMQRLDAHLTEYDASEVEAGPNDDGLSFALGRGYRVDSEMRYAGTDLRSLPPEPERPPGIEVVPMFGLDAGAVFPAYQESGLDIPATPVDASFEWFQQVVWESPSVAREFSFAAVDGGQVVCCTISLKAATGLWTDMTGTVRSHRGRGLARVVKWAALRAAADAGLTAAYTANSEENQAMLAVNRWLGYRPVARHTVVRRKFR
ncbi:GNAT family N-acetyltransferase [Kribbella sp. NPDC051718]|uniref:GNAT family N-acetyltransferase n=1 Tax=Kribbella sp. NPDC051718 TaxID=3155168 RepID=UPI00343C2631